MKNVKLICAIMLFLIIVGCTGRYNKDETELILSSTKEFVADENFAVTGNFGENDIIISELYSDVTLNTIPIEYDANGVFLSMVDEKKWIFIVLQFRGRRSNDEIVVFDE